MLGLTPIPNDFIELDLDIRKIFLWSYVWPNGNSVQILGKSLGRKKL